jgi:hypothetical protein
VSRSFSKGYGLHGAYVNLLWQVVGLGSCLFVTLVCFGVFCKYERGKTRWIGPNEVMGALGKQGKIISRRHSQDSSRSQYHFL